MDYSSPMIKSKTLSEYTMAIYQVSKIGTRYTVLVDGVPSKTFDTRGEAIQAALVMKEGPV